MAKYLLSGEGINWLAIMALVTFFIIFTLVLIMVFGRNRQSYEEVAQLPLQDQVPHTKKEE